MKYKAKGITLKWSKTESKANDKKSMVHKPNGVLSHI